MIARIAKLAKREDRGATAVEYGLLVTLIALAIIGAMSGLATALIAMFGHAATALNP
jgi:pilus assembly protein Flp/PilA